MASRRRIKSYIKRTGLFLLESLGLAAAGYILFALVFSTDEEKQLALENRLYSGMHDEMISRESLVSDVVSSLEIRDNEIFKELFNTDAPPVDPVGSAFVPLEADAIPTSKLVPYVRDKSDSLMQCARHIDENFDKVLMMLSRSDEILPPMALPVDGISYPQTGASVGKKINPFYKTETMHEGIDLMAPLGTVVMATADGEVTQVTKSVRGLGNRVVISHPGGYTTTYAHLSEISVRKGARVRRGQQIGLVGRTGKVYAPHLHYELRRDGEVLDPVHYFFASIPATGYANILYSSINTKQSMD